MQPLLEPSLSETLRQNLVPSSVQELDRRGFRAVKVLPREAVNRLVAEAAAKLVEERTARALADEREAARLERIFLEEQVERARLDAAAAERRAEAARLERQASLEEAEEARRAKEAAERHALETEEAFQGARRAAEAAERALALARAGFEREVRELLADPAAVSPHRKKSRAEGLRRAKDAVRRLEAAPLAGKRAGSTPIELVWRRSIGFGAPAPRPVEQPKPTPPAQVAAVVGEKTERMAALEPRATARLEARLAEIERKLDLALLRQAQDERLGEVRGEEGKGGDGVPSRFGPGVPAGLKGSDPRYREKNAILRRLVEENVKLRRDLGTGGRGS